MAISYPLALPDTTSFVSCEIVQHSVVAVSESPFTFASQVQRHTGQRWSAELVLKPMKRAAAEPWLAFLASLNGPEGTFLLGDPLGVTGRGVLTGTPLVKGGSQTGQDLLIDGATAGVTGWIKAGDWVQLGTGSTSRLHKQLVDANSNGSGEVTLTLWPRLRAAPADNAAVTVASCKGVFRLMPGQSTSWRADRAAIYSIGFSAIEVV